MTITDPNTSIRNGVDTTALFATLDVVREQPQLAEFQFRARNRWISGTHNRSTINGYYGAGQEHSRVDDFGYDADHPPVLTGGDHGPTPVEFLLHALAACLTSGLVNIAAARGITLHEVSSTVEGDIDLLGILGLDRDTRNGYQRIKVTFTISGDASAEQLRELVSRSQRRSAVLDVLTHGTQVEVDVVTV
ncbi:MAG: OsmC family protein [Propionibacteriaceae bacterium]